MSEARDVIARALASVGAFDSEGEATVVDMALHAAGYRIAGPEDRVIGKGEYDPVTLDRVCEVVNEIAARGYSAAYRGGAMDCDAAIRNLGRKA